MLDLGVLPPEVTSAQLYSGPGSGPMMVAASAWDTLAGQAGSFAQGFSSVVAGLQGEYWAGPAAAAMAAAAAPYGQWAAATGVQAEQTAVQLRAAAAGFEAAHAAVTPPAVVAANRAQLGQLIATNVLGHNAAAIAATEAAYQGMWAQNSAAMYGYAGAASSASKLSAFSQPPQTTNPAGASAAPATAAVAQGQAAVSNALQNMSTPGATTTTATTPGIPVPQSVVTDLSDLNTIMSFDDAFFDKMRSFGSITHAALAWIRISTDGMFYAPLSGGLISAGLTSSTSPAALAGQAGTVLAGTGAASTVGRLSVPAAWASATPAGGVTDRLPALASAAWETTPRVGVAGTGPGSALAPIAQATAAAALAKKLKRPSVSTILQVTPPRYTMPRPSSGG